MDYRTNTIAQLWNGHIEPIRHLGEDNPQIDQLKAFMKGTYEKLEKNLEGRNKRLLENYSRYVCEYLVLMGEEAFCDGYCLGTKLTVQSLTKE